ncbi:hypothetical protein POTOM_060325 [Populus tomentosa]|uniref:Sec23/Sec24 protein transport family protein n=1 Tax=Populus tomentosa TaxID=118781 RepID=A0A8X7Y095_POPTO|nr:hypothetical protein POTOM_060325 [Populus tomentosa]
MASNVPAGAPRQPPPPSYNPNYQQNPNILSDNFQNLNLNRPSTMPNSAPRPSPFGQPPPFPSSAPSPQFSRPGAPPPGVVPRPSVPPSGLPSSTFPPNVTPGRPTGLPFGQPQPFGQTQPFGSRPPPGSFPSSASSGLAMGPVSGAPPQGSLVPPLGSRPSPAAPSSSPLSMPPSSSFGGLMSNGPPAPAFQSAPRFPSPVSAPQQPPMGPPPTVGLARAPPQSMRQLMGSSGISGQPVAPFSAPPQGTPFSAQHGMAPPPVGSPFAPQMQPQSVARFLAEEMMVTSFFTAYAVLLYQFEKVNLEAIAGNQYKDIDIEDRKKIEVKNRGRRTKKREKKIRGGCVVIGDKKGLGSFMEFYCIEIISSFGWKEMQEYKVAQPPPIPGSAQPPRMFGMPPPLPNQMTAISPVMGQTGSPLSGASKIDPNQIPRPIPGSSVILHDTRAGNQANPPPPAISDYIVTDTGNCSPRYMRCTINQIPCTVDLLSTSGMPLALLLQPLALPHPSEDPVQVVDFGESGPVRCSRCKGYINPFMKFIDQGRQFICNLCGFTDETPRDYHCNLGPDGRRRDADERPELCRGTVEFVATKEYMVRDPMPAVYFFLIDVSMHAIQTGATAAACSSINQVIADLPEGPRTMVGIATFDSTIHFYNLKRALQQNSRIAESAFSAAAIKAAFLAMKNTGGKLLVFQSGKLMNFCGSDLLHHCNLTCIVVYNIPMEEVTFLPSVGIGALSAREAEGRSNISAGEKEAHKLLQPADKTMKEMAIEFAEYQVCVDVFITTQTYVDIASISVIPKTTGGQSFGWFHAAYLVRDIAAMILRRELLGALLQSCTMISDGMSHSLKGFEAVMRVRCSQEFDVVCFFIGIQVQEYHGNFCKRIPTDIDLATFCEIDCDKTIMVTLNMMISCRMAQMCFPGLTIIWLEENPCDKYSAVFSPRNPPVWCQQLMKTQVLQWSIHFARGPIQPPA